MLLLNTAILARATYIASTIARLWACYRETGLSNQQHLAAEATGFQQELQNAKRIIQEQAKHTDMVSKVQAVAC